MLLSIITNPKVIFTSTILKSSCSQFSLKSKRIHYGIVGLCFSWVSRFGSSRIWLRCLYSGKRLNNQSDDQGMILLMFSNTFTDRTNLFMQHSGRNIQCRCMDGRRKSRSRQHPDRKVIVIDFCTVVLGKHFSCHPNLPFRISGGHPNCNNGTFLLSSKYIYQRLLVPRKF